MAKAADIGDRVCLNHPERAATARCAQCRRPICSACVRSHDGEIYCSEACADARAHYHRREGERQRAGRARERFGIGEWALRGILILLAALILYDVLVVQEVRSIGGFIEMLKRRF